MTNLQQLQERVAYLSQYTREFTGKASQTLANKSEGDKLEDSIANDLVKALE